MSQSSPEEENTDDDSDFEYLQPCHDVASGGFPGTKVCEQGLQEATVDNIVQTLEEYRLYLLEDTHKHQKMLDAIEETVRNKVLQNVQNHQFLEEIDSTFFLGTILCSPQEVASEILKILKEHQSPLLEEVTPGILKILKEHQSRLLEEIDKRIQKIDTLTDLKSEPGPQGPPKSHSVEDDEEPEKEKYNALVFQGGGAKGIAYVGVCKELKERKILENVKRFGGASAGAICAAFLAMDFSPEELQDLLSTNFQKMLLGDEWYDRNKYTQFVFRFVEFLMKFGLFSTSSFYEWLGIQFEIGIQKKIDLGKDNLKRIMNPKDITFKEVKEYFDHELCIVVTNVCAKMDQYYHLKTTPNFPVREAVRMSMSIPVICHPKILKLPACNEDEYFIDGGVTCNYPLHCFDGWWLSLEETDSFVEKLHQEQTTIGNNKKDDLGYLFDIRTEGFKSSSNSEQSRTLGFCVKSGRDLIEDEGPEDEEERDKVITDYWKKNQKDSRESEQEKEKQAGKERRKEGRTTGIFSLVYDALSWILGMVFSGLYAFKKDSNSSKTENTGERKEEEKDENKTPKLKKTFTTKLPKTKLKRKKNAENKILNDGHRNIKGIMEFLKKLNKDEDGILTVAGKTIKRKTICDELTENAPQLKRILRKREECKKNGDPITKSNKKEDGKYRNLFSWIKIWIKKMIWGPSKEKGQEGKDDDFILVTLEDIEFAFLEITKRPFAEWITNKPWTAIRNIKGYGFGVYNMLTVQGRKRREYALKHNKSNTIIINTAYVDMTDFELEDADKKFLINEGKHTARAFLDIMKDANSKTNENAAENVRLEKEEEEL